MKYIDEFRDPALARRLADELAATVTRPWTLMEVCGGQTHAIVRFGLDQMLPEGVELIHGPGCPVCVTPAEVLDAACALVARPEVTLCTFGDMLRVPGSRGQDLSAARARGGDVRIVYAPLDAVRLAAAHPEREVVLLAVGFETTAPANAMAVLAAARQGLDNFSMLVSHVLVPPALRAILDADANRVQGFLAAGHVCTIMGWRAYEPIAAQYRVPIAVTGFEPLDILHGVLSCVRRLEAGKPGVDNPYARAVREQGNEPARALIERVFCVQDRAWRGIGRLPDSGLGLRREHARFDAALRFPDLDLAGEADAGQARQSECIAGAVLQGAARPTDCPAFGTRCTPDRPLGAPMVSSEGACAAYHRYRPAPHDEV